MADKKVRQFQEVTVLADPDNLVVDNGADPLKRITVANAKVSLSTSVTTASNVGVGGVGPFKQKTGDNLEFKNVNAGSSKISITEDVPNNEIDVDVVEANLALQNMGGTATISQGGTGQTTQTEGFDALAPTTGKGDVIVHNGTDNVREPVGANNQVLTADSAQASGVKWETPTVGEANTASNVGAGGVGVFKQKTGVDLEFKNINVGSSKLTILNDAPNNEIDLDVSEANLTLDNIGGTLSLSKGGTGQTTQTPAFDALAPTTTKGDLIVHDGTDNIREAIGTDGQFLSADSAQASGVNWVNQPLGIVQCGPGSDTSSTKAPYSAVAAGTNGSAFFSLSVPSDFASVSRMFVRLIPGSTFVAVDIDVTLNTNPVGTLFTSNSSTDTTSTFSFTLDQISEIDITTLTGSISAGNEIGVEFDNNAIGGTIFYTSLVLEYVRS